jgi:hypothetical protein
MEGYLGETPLRTVTGAEAALTIINLYGQIDGEHHKQWVIDQVARILLGTPVTVVLAKWANGHQEERFRTGEPTVEYAEWVKRAKAGEDGPETYDYDEGIAP